MPAISRGVPQDAACLQVVEQVIVPGCVAVASDDGAVAGRPAVSSADARAHGAGQGAKAGQLLGGGPGPLGLGHDERLAGVAVVRVSQVRAEGEAVLRRRARDAVNPAVVPLVQRGQAGGLEHLPPGPVPFLGEEALVVGVASVAAEDAAGDAVAGGAARDRVDEVPRGSRSQARDAGQQLRAAPPAGEGRRGGLHRAGGRRLRRAWRRRRGLGRRHGARGQSAQHGGDGGQEGRLPAGSARAIHGGTSDGRRRDARNGRRSGRRHGSGRRWRPPRDDLRCRAGGSGQSGSEQGWLLSWWTCPPDGAHGFDVRGCRAAAAAYLARWHRNAPRAAADGQVTLASVPPVVPGAG